MINFRFHIVSLTAVLLAARHRAGARHHLPRRRAGGGAEEPAGGPAGRPRPRPGRNDDLQAQLDAYEDEAWRWGPAIGERLYRGQLTGDPVLIVSTRGVEQEWVDNVMQSLSQADANLVGVWWLTDRMALDDDSEVEDLAQALETDTDDADRLERRLVVELADAMFGATDGSAAEPPGASADFPAAAAEAALLARLHEGGFIDYEMPEGVDGDVVLLPASGLRIVVVDGPGAAIPASLVLQPVLSDLTEDGPVSVVAVEPEVRRGPDRRCAAAAGLARPWR